MSDPGALLTFKEPLGVQPVSQMVAVACNRDPNAVDWLTEDSNTIAFGGGRFAAIYDVDNTCIVATLRAHRQRVNVVKWMPLTRNGVTESRLHFGCAHCKVLVCFGRL